MIEVVSGNGAAGGHANAGHVERRRDLKTTTILANELLVPDAGASSESGVGLLMVGKPFAERHGDHGNHIRDQQSTHWCPTAVPVWVTVAR